MTARGKNLVRDALREGAATDEEIRDRIHRAGHRMAHGSVSKRRLDLLREGDVLQVPGITRTTRGGRAAKVYKLAGYGY